MEWCSSPLGSPSVLLSWLPTLLAGLVGGLLLALVHDVTRFPRDSSKVPGPASLPLLDQSLELHLNRHRFLSWLLDYSKKFHGKTWSFKVMFRPRVFCVVEPRCVEHVLKIRFESYGKGPKFHARMKELLGDGIFNVDGPLWYEQRKISSHLFTHKHFKQGMVPAVDSKALEVVSILQAQTSGGVAERVDLSRLLLRFTLDSIGSIAFGKDLGSLRGESEGFVRSFDYLQSYLNQLVLKPPGYALIARHMTSAGREYDRALAVLNAYVRGMVREAMARRDQSSMQEQDEEDDEEEREEAGGASRGPDDDGKREEGGKGHSSGGGDGTDLLSLFLARGEQRRGTRQAEEDYLRDVVVNMTIAGRDTTAYALAWALHLLSRHPHVQDQARHEALAAGAGDLASPLDYSVMEAQGRLAYLDAVFTETLRLYPSVPKNPKCAFVDDVLPDGTFIPKGSYVMYSPWVMGRMVELWGPDAEAFDPERHHLVRPTPTNSSHRDEHDDDDDASTKNKTTAAASVAPRAIRPSASLWPAFQAGPRTCLGQRLAYMEAKALLARLVANFRFEPADGVPAPSLEENALTTPMQGQGLVLKVTSINHHDSSDSSNSSKQAEAQQEVKGEDMVIGGTTTTTTTTTNDDDDNPLKRQQ